MTKFLKSSAIAAVVATFAAPAFAAEHMDPSMVTCDEYNQLTGAERDKLAVMAVSSLQDNVDPTDGTARAVDDSVGETAEESNMAASEGTATATSIADADDDMTRFSEEIGVLNRTCSRNWDTTVLQAASGGGASR